MIRVDPKTRAGGVSALTRIACAAILIATAACESRVTPATAGGYSVRDSSGVRIVEYEGQPAPTHSITLTELFRHGDREGDYLFSVPFSGGLQPDGSVVVGDARNSEVVVIGSDGTLLSILATEGQGPGEVRPGMAIRVLGQDVVLVRDPLNRRVTVFENGVPRSVRDEGVRIDLRGVDAQERVLLASDQVLPDATGTPWIQGSLIRFDVRSATYDTVGTFDWLKRGGWNDSPYWADGRAAVSGGTFVHGRTDQPELVWRNADGAVRQITRWRPTRVYPSEANWEELLEAVRSELLMARRGPEWVEENLQLITGRYVVDRDQPLPLYRVLRGDRDGGLWLGAYTPGLDPRFVLPARYDLVDPEGIWLGTLESPPGFKVLDVSGDRVLGVVRDDFDVETIAVYELRMSPL
jgi:hypothetical protein